MGSKGSVFAAVLELTERYEGLVSELDHTAHAHRALTAFQKQLGDELHVSLANGFFSRLACLTWVS